MSIKKTKKTHKKKNHKRTYKKTYKKSYKKTYKKQNGGKCDYIHVQGVNLDGLTIPDQYAKVDTDCSNNVSVDSKVHPNV